MAGLVPLSATPRAGTEAAARKRNLREQHYLTTRAARLAGAGPHEGSARKD